MRPRRHRCSAKRHEAHQHISIKHANTKQASNEESEAHINETSNASHELCLQGLYQILKWQSHKERWR